MTIWQTSDQYISLLNRLEKSVEGEKERIKAETAFGTKNSRLLSIKTEDITEARVATDVATPTDRNENNGTRRTK